MNKCNSKTRLYRIWNGMKQRCNNPKSSTWKWYGGKGVKVCDEWENNFLNFKEWALSNGYNDNLTIDRIDPLEDYSPENCQWLTISENAAKAVFSRDQKAWEKKTRTAYLDWYANHEEQKQIETRLKYIERIIQVIGTCDIDRLNLICLYTEYLAKTQKTY